MVASRFDILGIHEPHFGMVEVLYFSYRLLCFYQLCLATPIGTGLGAVSIRKTVLPGMAIPMLKIRRPNGRLIFNMENAIRR